MRASHLEALDRLIRPRTVAIVGASSDPNRTTGRPSRYLTKHGFTGTTYLVNPRATEIDGLPCFPSIADLPNTPDAALVLVGPDLVEEAVRELARIGTPAAIVLAGGYAESDAEGAARQQALKAAAGPMRILGPNTIGLVNVVDGVALSPSVALEIAPLTPGRVGLVSQSGGLLGSVLSRAEARGIGFSRLVATGNEADIEVVDVVEYLLDDPETDVIALYLEGLRSAERFRAAADRAASIGKPIVAFKVGRSEPGARSAASHTGALAGSDRVYDALFEQHGVIRVDSFMDLLDVPAALASGRRLAGRRLAVLTSTGGAGVLVADAAGVHGFEAPPPDRPTVDRLAALLPGEAALAERNPVDVTLAGVRADIFRASISALLASSTYDAIIVIVGSSGLAQPDLAAGPVVESLAESEKPVVVYVSPSAPNIVSYLNRRHVPAFDTPEGCAAALHALYRVSTHQPPSPRVAASAPEVEPLVVPTGRLNEWEAKQLFARFGIQGVRERVAAMPEEAARVAAELGQRVVVKVLAREIDHKSEHGGVRIGVPPSEVADAAREILANVGQTAADVPIEGLLVQEMVSGGLELILGVTHDPQLGAAILLGAGGVATELYQDIVLRLPPITLAQAHQMIARLRSHPLLTGYRGRPACDLDALASAIVGFSQLVQMLGDRLVEAEINPLFVLRTGQGVRAADGLMVLR